jgi:hypothetical protein
VKNFGFRIWDWGLKKSGIRKAEKSKWLGVAGRPRRFSFAKMLRRIKAGPYRALGFQGCTWWPRRGGGQVSRKAEAGARI